MIEKLKRIKKLIDRALTFLNFKEAESLARRGVALSQTIKDKFYLSYFKAQEAIIAGRLKTAIRYLDKALRENPYDIETYNDKALCLADLKKFDEALDCIDYALKNIAESKLLYHNKGWILLEKNRLREAIFNLRKALEFDEKYSPAWANLGECFRRQGDYLRSLKYYRMALDSVPKKYKDLRRMLKREIVNLESLIKRIQRKNAE